MGYAAMPASSMDENIDGVSAEPRKMRRCVKSSQRGGRKSERGNI